MRYFQCITLILLLTFVLQPLLFPVIFAEENTVLIIDEVFKKIDPDKVTKEQVREYYNEVGGKKIKGEGTVVDILPGSRDNIRIEVLAAGSTSDMGFNIMLYVNKELCADINKDDQIAFEGLISQVSSYKGARIDINVSTIQKIKKKK